MTTSVFLMNLGWVFLLVNWTAEWIGTGKDFRRERLENLRNNRLLQAFLLLTALHLVAMLWSANWLYGLDDIRKKLPLLAVPLVILTSRPLQRRAWGNVLGCYVAAVVVVSVVGLVRYFTMADLPYREIIPFISHIRFSLNICLVVALLLWQGVHMVRDLPPERRWYALFYLVGIAYFLFYLFLLQSYTGMAVLFVLAAVLLVAYWKRMCNRPLRNALFVVWLVMLLAVVGVSVYYVNDYYRLRPLSSQPLQSCTANGNPYRHECDGFVECGNYVNNYVCEKELQEQWTLVSDVSLDSITALGYAVRPALVRYLNAMGCTKDSAGVACLTPEDVSAIEKGIANPVYLKHPSLRKMYDIMLFEYESYRCYHSVRDFTMLQRFELWRNGWEVFRCYFITGTGTGDVVDECHTQLQASDSPLAGTTKHVHNQYLTFLITFGSVGFVLIVFAFVRGVRQGKRWRRFPFLVVLTVSLISFFTEDTLETLAGCMFVAFFWSYFASPMPSEEESPSLKEP